METGVLCRFLFSLPPKEKQSRNDPEKKRVFAVSCDRIICYLPRLKENKLIIYSFERLAEIA
jgi:hypothetical protein